MSVAANNVPAMAPPNVLVVSQERIAERMAGPAVRAYEVARALAGTSELAVTLAAPPGSFAPGGSGGERADATPFELVEVSLGTPAFVRLARGHDVVVAQFLPGSVLARLIGAPLRLVLDLYNPRPLEVLERFEDDDPGALRRRVRADAAEMLAYLAAADFVVCASERQRDLLIGGLMLAGMIEPERYGADPTYRSFVDVVPFGIPDEPPRRRGRPVLKGAWPGIAEGDRVVVWAGGVWDWLDALTAVKAVERAAAELPGLKLFFLGTGRPPEGEAGPFPAMHATRELERYVRERGLGGLVFLNPDWVPYGERAAYLLEADLGVSAHHDHLEARYAFRARTLDYLWAGLPVVATEGDVLADLIGDRLLGRTVPPGDPEAMAESIKALLGDCAERERTAARVASIAPELHWSRAVEPLRAFCLQAEHAPRPHPARARRLTRRSRLRRLRLILRDRGPSGIAAEALAKARRMTRRR